MVIELEPRSSRGIWSRTLLPTEKNYFVPEKECFAVVWAQQTMRLYLQGERFILHLDQVLLQWLTGTTEPSGQLMRWKLRLSKITFDTEYKKENLNIQAYALFRLKSLRHTTVALDKDIPTYPDEAKLTQEQITLMSNSDVSDRVLLSHGDSQSPPLVPTTIDVLLRKQQADHFCRDLIAMLQNGEDMSFSQSENSILICLAYCDEQADVPKAL